MWKNTAVVFCRVAPLRVIKLVKIELTVVLQAKTCKSVPLILIIGSSILSTDEVASFFRATRYLRSIVDKDTCAWLCVRMLIQLNRPAVW